MTFWLSLYHALGARGFSPQQVDGMELWQAAAVLGAHLDVPGEEPLTVDAAAAIRQPDPRSGVASTRARRASRQPPATARRNLIAERMAHARGEGPRPEADPTGVGMVDVMRRMAGGG